MKKMLPYALIFIIAILAIPALSVSNQEQAFTPIIAQNTDIEKDVQVDNEIMYKVFNHKTGEVFEISPLDYIKGVVAAEMPISFQKDALSAQAIAAHTYAMRQIDAELRKPTPELMGAFLTTDFEKNQAYISDDELKVKWGSNYTINSKKLDEAVRLVIDKIMVVDDKPIIAAFHSLNTGTTESAKNVWGQDVPYLSPVKSEGDSLSPKYNNDMVFTSDEISYALKTAYPDIVLEKDKSTWFNIVERSPSGTVLKVKVGSIECTGKEIREILILKSACFEVTYNDDVFKFSTKGYGHGVGMSQYGADFLARQGSSYEDILSHYYKDVEIIDIKNLNKAIDIE